MAGFIQAGVTRQAITVHRAATLLTEVELQATQVLRASVHLAPITQGATIAQPMPLALTETSMERLRGVRQQSINSSEAIHVRLQAGPQAHVLVMLLTM